MCFSVNFTKFLRTPLTEHLRWLLQRYLGICNHLFKYPRAWVSVIFAVIFDIFNKLAPDLFVQKKLVKGFVIFNKLTVDLFVQK